MLLLTTLFLSLQAHASSMGGVSLGGVTNDPFLNRYVIKTDYIYKTNTAGLKVNVGFSPDLGQADWKPLTKQLVEENSVSPDISKLTAYSSVSLIIPITTIADDRRSIQIDGFGGSGLVQTHDDLTALDAEDDPRAQSTQYQWHPTLNLGMTMILSKADSRVLDFPSALMVNLESMQYIETINATTLEHKSNLIISIGLLFGGKQ